MFEKEKEELRLAEERLKKYTLNIVKGIMSKTKEEIIEYATSYLRSGSKIKTTNYEIIKKDDCFLVRYFSSNEDELFVQIEIDNPTLNNFFDTMIDGYFYEEDVKRTENINRFLKVVES